MSAPTTQATQREGALVLADISGYTRFLQGVADAHRDLIIEAPEPPVAYAVMSGLLDAIVTAMAPTFHLVKFEGDAVFAVSEDGRVDGQAVLDALSRSYAAFHERLMAAGSEWICNCSACSTIHELDLKFIAHHGRYVAQPIAGHEELLGPDVNLAHRLLKNRAREVVGPVPYVLITDAAVRALDVPTDGMVAAEEHPEGGATVPVHVLPLESSRRPV